MKNNTLKDVQEKLLVCYEECGAFLKYFPQDAEALYLQGKFSGLIVDVARALENKYPNKEGQ